LAEAKVLATYLAEQLMVYQAQAVVVLEVVA
jgi:hypothetical protein